MKEVNFCNARKMFTPDKNNVAPNPKGQRWKETDENEI